MLIRGRLKATCEEHSYQELKEVTDNLKRHSAGGRRKRRKEGEPSTCGEMGELRGNKIGLLYQREGRARCCFRSSATRWTRDCRANSTPITLSNDGRENTVPTSRLGQDEHGRALGTKTIDTDLQKWHKCPRHHFLHDTVIQYAYKRWMEPHAECQCLGKHSDAYCRHIFSWSMAKGGS